MILSPGCHRNINQPGVGSGFGAWIAECLLLTGLEAHSYCSLTLLGGLLISPSGNPTLVRGSLRFLFCGSSDAVGLLAATFPKEHIHKSIKSPRPRTYNTNSSAKPGRPESRKQACEQLLQCCTSAWEGSCCCTENLKTAHAPESLSI